MNRSRASRALPWLAAAALCVVAILARQYLIQPPDIAHACPDEPLTLFTSGPWWCGVRNAVIMTYAWNGLLYGSLVAALVALLVRRAWVAWLALALGLLAIVWYTYEAGAVAITIGALVLARAQERPAPPPRRR